MKILTPRNSNIQPIRTHEVSCNDINTYMNEIIMIIADLVLHINLVE